MGHVTAEVLCCRSCRTYSAMFNAGLPAGRAVCCGGSPHWQAAFAALASLSLSQRGTVRLWGCPAGQSKVRQVTVLA